MYERPNMFENDRFWAQPHTQWIATSHGGIGDSHMNLSQNRIKMEGDKTSHIDCLNSTNDTFSKLLYN
jgi:hypothetical protein